MLTMIKRTLAALAIVLAGAAVPAVAAECGKGGNGTMSISYDTGKTALTREHRAKLAKFADVAKHQSWVCVFAQVDAQGSDEVNKRVANARSQNVKKFLISKGVPAANILIASQEKGITLFGLLGDDKQSDRRVTVSYE